MRLFLQNENSPRTFPNYFWESYKMRLRATVWPDVVFIWERRELLSWETILGSFFFLAILGSVLWIASSGQKRESSRSILHLVVTCSERGARQGERDGELPVFWGDEKSLATPLAKHEISMRVFKAGDVLRRQMLYRLSTDGFQETLSFILLVQCQ